MSEYPFDVGVIGTTAGRRLGVDGHGRVVLYRGESRIPMGDGTDFIVPSRPIRLTSGWVFPVFRCGCVGWYCRELDETRRYVWNGLLIGVCSHAHAAAGVTRGAIYLPTGDRLDGRPHA